MTDSSIDEKSGEGDFDVGPSMDELFGEIEELEEGAVDREETQSADDVEDVTAADVFSQLRTEAAEESGVDDVLEDESPEEIIASADDETDSEADELDADLVDEGALDDLLLTGRTRSDEFLWVDSGGADEDSSATEAKPEPSTEPESDTDSSMPDDTDDEADENVAISNDAPIDAGLEQSDSDPTEFTAASESDPAAGTASEATTDSSPSDEPEREGVSAPLESEADTGTKTETDTESDEPATTTDDDVKETPTSNREASSSSSSSDDDSDGDRDGDDKTTPTGRVDYALESDADDASPEDESLVVSDVESTTTDLVPTETESDDSGGFLSWIRSKLPF